MLCSAKEVEYVCRLCDPEKSWIADLQRHAAGLYDRVLTELGDLFQSGELASIREKMVRCGYQSCAEFLADVHQLSGQSDSVESALLAVMPWTKPEEKITASKQAVTVGVKVCPFVCVLNV